MNNVPGWILELKKTNVIDLQSKYAAKEQVPGLMHNYAGKRQNSDDNSRDKKHMFLLLPFLAASKSFVVFLAIDDYSRAQAVAKSR